jgi:hypothetical protein
MPRKTKTLTAVKKAKKTSKSRALTKRRQSVIERVMELPTLCYIEKDAIVFRIEDLAFYDISLRQCDTYDKILGWQVLLSAKRWVDNDILFRFTTLACDYHNLPITFP